MDYPSGVVVRGSKKDCLQSATARRLTEPAR